MEVKNSVLSIEISFWEEKSNLGSMAKLQTNLQGFR